MDESFHAGELAVQERTGERAPALRSGALIREALMAGAAPFLAQQRMVAVAGVDAEGSLWASLWFGEAGFVKSVDERTITLERSLPHDAWEPLCLGVGATLGVLAIELESRRRLRINGVVLG